MLQNIVDDNENFGAERDDSFGWNNERRRNRHWLFVLKRGRDNQDAGSAYCRCTRKVLLDAYGK